MSTRDCGFLRALTNRDFRSIVDRFPLYRCMRSNAEDIGRVYLRTWRPYPSSFRHRTPVLPDGFRIDRGATGMVFSRVCSNRGVRVSLKDMPPRGVAARTIGVRSVTAVVPIPRCYFAMPEYNCLCTRRALFEITLGNRTALPPDTPPSVQVSRSLRAPGVYKPGAHTFAECSLATNRPPIFRFSQFRRFSFCDFQNRLQLRRVAALI